MKPIPIVILPGWLLGSSRFTSLSRVLEKHGYRTYVVDFPGFAQGEVLTKAYDLTDYVKFLEKYLKSKGINQAVFVCHSFGGRVALKMLSQNPHKGAALILSGTPGFRSVNLRILLTKLISSLAKTLSFIPPVLFFRKRFQHFLYRLVGSGDYLKTTGLLRSTFKNIIKEPLIEYMKKIRIPTLLIWGGKDGLVSTRIAKKMQQTIKNSQLIILPNEKHNVIYKNPDLFAKHILDFLATL